MATFRYDVLVPREVFEANDKEIFRWLVERFGRSALSVSSENNAVVKGIIRNGRIDQTIDLDIDERWFWYGERYYFKNENDHFEFKIRWG